MSGRQVTTVAVVAFFSWYGMMAVHEFGHCLGAVVTGAAIEAVVIPIAGFSRTDFSGGSSPLLVVWAGPALGAAMPVALLALLGLVGRWVRHGVMFFVGFCLLANGAYIGMGAFLGTGDCEQLLQHGSPLWLLVALGAVSFGVGLYVWHRMGPPRAWFAPDGQDEGASNRLQQAK